MVLYARSIPFSALLCCSNIRHVLWFRSLYRPMDACCLKRLLVGFTEIAFPRAKEVPSARPGWPQVGDFEVAIRG